MEEKVDIEKGDRVRVVQYSGGRKDVIKEGIAVEIFTHFVRVCDPKEVAEISNLKFCEVFPYDSPAGLKAEFAGRPKDKDKKTMQEILKWL